jgi:hypothetical protein
MRVRKTVGAFLLGSILIGGGCVAVPAKPYYYRYGHAPYGTRYVTADGIAVTYEYGPGVYTVVGRPGLYWWGGHYYRRHNGYWEWSRHHRGPWAYRSARKVPFATRVGRYAGRGRGWRR